MKKISVICCVYNTEKYLDQCLKSVQNQTMKKEEFELIIVNDGSIDNSEKIIKKYLKNNPNWKYIKQENQGLSKSRNNALNIVSGKYVTYLDSDDYLLEDALESMYNECKENGAEISIFRANTFNSTGEYPDYYNSLYDKLPSITNLNKTAELTKAIRSVAILYKYDIVKKVRFIENVVHEDGYYCLACFNKAANIYISKSVVYMIRIREGSDKSIMQNLSYKTFKDHIYNMTKADLEIKNSNLITYHLGSMVQYIINNLKKEDKLDAHRKINDYLKNMLDAKIISCFKYMYFKFKVYIKLYIMR